MVIYLIDGNGFCYRAFHAIRELRNSKGQPTNVVYGFSLMLKKILDDFKPDGLAVSFDTKEPTFRHKRYEAYKSHRKPMPEELVSQMPVVRKLVEAFRIALFEKEGYEADDVLGTVAKAIAEWGHEVVIVTGDKDILQLVNERIKVLNPQKDYLLYDAREVENKFGVKPPQVADVLSLMGDSSDFIPGVRGIGEKTAVELIRKFGDLEHVLQNVEKIPQDSRRRAIQEDRDNALLSKDLAQIDQGVPLEFSLKDFEIKKPDFEKLRSLYQELEFRSMLKNLPLEADKPPVAKEYRLITKASEWSELFSELEACGEFSFDFETTGTDALSAELVGLSFSMEPYRASFVLFSSHKSKKSSLEARRVLEDLKGVFENPRQKKIGQNIKYEMTLLKRFGIALEGVSFDTMIGSYLLNSSKRNHNLSDIALDYLGERLTPIQHLIGKGKSAITMAEADLEELTAYGCQDADVTYRLARLLRGKLEEAGMMDLLREIDLPLVEILCGMEMAGISVDCSYLEEVGREMNRSLEELTRRIHKAARGEFNINSTQQLGEVLFERLGLPALGKTKTGRPSTDVEVLTELSEMHGLPKLVLEYRELSKLKSTYVDAIPDRVHPRTGRIHSSFNQTVTETGRLSSNEPNLQNIPVRTEEGRRIRKAFVAGEGRVLLSADYSQIELRVLAHFSKDPNLRKAFVEGQDVHAYTAALVFGVDQEQITADMRERAKTVNFGVLYGMSAFGLSRALKITQEAAKDFIRSYFERYPGVKAFLDETIKTAKRRGYVETLWKRRRYIPDISSTDVRSRQYAERTAINAPVQGTASDLIKLAMIALHRDLEDFGYRVSLLLQVHDELIFEVEENGLRDLAGIVKKDMEGVAQLDVPIGVTLKSGRNWLEMEPVA